MSQKRWIILFVIVGCLLMALVDGSSMDYVSKALLKITTFLSIPLIYAKWIGKIDLKPFFRFEWKAVRLALSLGLILIALILTLYFVIGSWFDLSILYGILDRNFTAGTLAFLPIAFYIAFINSFLEEFFFRVFAYLSLKKVSSNKFASVFSALAFSLYHLFLMAGLFELWVYLTAICLLAIAGVIFNRLDQRSETLYPSWILHACANWGLNLIALILLKVI